MLVFYYLLPRDNEHSRREKRKEKKVSAKNKSRCHRKATAYVRAAEMNY